MIKKLEYEGPLGWKDVAYQVEDLFNKVNEILDWINTHGTGSHIQMAPIPKGLEVKGQKNEF
jgi:hypothetical protein